MKATFLALSLLGVAQLAGCARSGVWELSTYGTQVGRYELSDQVVAAVAFDYMSGAYIPNAAYPYQTIGKPLEWQRFNALGFPDMTGRKHVWTVGGVSGVFIGDAPAPSR